ncbi:hypothetical protein U9M48_025593 [Paspalum notatum var. saurae]|uniref:Uncharacterized protein n=1 Tax=Paspalum notatum var. saurae TaxID=547442 RepID=A0AAQ3TQ02_PASNO
MSRRPWALQRRQHRGSSPAGLSISAVQLL